MWASRLLAVLLALAAPAAWPARLHHEAWYQARWCAAAQGRTEVILADRTRVDCLTATHAIEFDFADKWAEAIGQALHYAALTGRRPGIVLILETPDQARYLARLRETIAGVQPAIDLWVLYGWSSSAWR